LTKQNLRERRHFIYLSLMIFIKKDLSQFKNYLYKIYNDQKYTFKITFEFSVLLVLDHDEDNRGMSELLKNNKIKIIIN
jgi:hypothetical protein